MVDDFETDSLTLTGNTDRCIALRQHSACSTTVRSRENYRPRLRLSASRTGKLRGRLQ